MHNAHFKERARALCVFLSRVLPSLFWIFLLFGFDTPYIAVCTLLATLIHEGGHLLVAAAAGQRTPPPRGVLSGLRIRISGVLSYERQAVIALAGPLANLIAGGAALLFCGYRGAGGIFAVVQFLTAGANLIPIRGYDGYQALSSLLSRRADPMRVERALGAISFLLTATITFLALYMVEKAGTGFWVLGLFSALLFSEVLSLQKSNF